jgi:hypothetical protein
MPANEAMLNSYWPRGSCGTILTLFPALTDIDIRDAWEGLFAMTPDSLPYTGPHVAIHSIGSRLATEGTA